MENNLWKRFLIERKKRSYEQFQDKIFKKLHAICLGSVLLIFVFAFLPKLLIYLCRLWWE